MLTNGFSVQLYAGSLLTDVRGGREGGRQIAMTDMQSDQQEACHPYCGQDSKRKP